MVVMLKKLHPAQKELLKILAKNIDDPLTIRELQSRIGASSTSVVTHHIKQLEKKGYLKRNVNDPRDYYVVGSNPTKPMAYLNNYALAACGPRGSIFDGAPIDKIPVPTRLINFPLNQAFLVRAKGDSMEPKITNGDLVIVRKMPSGESGKIVVCINGGEAMIKKMFIEKQKVILVSLNNDQYKPFSASDDFRVEGVVKGVITQNI